MNPKPFVIMLVCLLLSVQCILMPRPVAAENESISQAINEADALVTAWSLPNLAYEETIQANDQCIRAAFAAREYNSTLTGTLHYSSPDDATYSPTPRDRLRVVYLDGATVGFTIADMQGYFERGVDGFLNRDYQVRCRTTIAERADLSLDVTRRGSDIILTTIGTLRFDETTYQVDLQGTSSVYFESSFGGSEYKLGTELQGEITGAGLEIAVADEFFFHIVTLDEESASVNHRASNSQWRIGSNQYQIQDALLTRSYKDGRPSRLETEWGIDGTLWRNGQRWGTLDSRIANDFFAVTAKGTYKKR